MQQVIEYPLVHRAIARTGLIQNACVCVRKRHGTFALIPNFITFPIYVRAVQGYIE